MCILAKLLTNEMRGTEYVENCGSRRAQGRVALRWQSMLDIHLQPTCPRTAANVLVITVAGAELEQEPTIIYLYIPVRVHTAINP